MQAGTARVTITPPVGTELSGYLARMQPSIGVHDELYAYALHLESGGEKLLWLHADLVGYEPGFAARVRAELAQRFGLAQRQVVLSATHTHAGPATIPLRRCGQMDLGYMEILERHLLGAAAVACGSTEHVTLRFAEGSAQVSRDRRRASPHSHTDPRLPVMALQRQDGTFAAVVANYAVHNVALSSNNRLISGDMAGVAADFARRNLPGEPAVLFTNGGCGNVNPLCQSDGFEYVEQYGTALGAATVQAARMAEPCDGETLTTVERSLTLALDVLSVETVQAQAERLLAGVAAMPPGYIKIRYGEAMTEWRDATLAALRNGTAPATHDTTLQVVRIGPVSWVCVPAEVFSRLADELRAAHTPKTYVVGYANGDMGYLPHRDAYAEGGYEVADAFKFYGTFMVAAGGYEQLRDEAIQMLTGIGAES
ncbi:MAG: hypothetical protein A3K19_10345 [Lentisphaerae bacterium RIFOXYB12_FULL_65_16]|nr:MAG: hypothetical protein A3K18_32205 [Lentisphaerae bacterium RIFOXYA12_64_32]OGV91616.1 MAG: hypothetical protein A3K19_10345 [Lentisphaerae bacterium RIFOXYB12_FULL_65_16]